MLALTGCVDMLNASWPLVGAASYMWEAHWFVFTTYSAIWQVACFTWNWTYFQHGQTLL